MSVPAFLLHTTTPYSLPNHVALAISPPRHRGTAHSACRRIRATTAAVGYLGLTVDDGYDGSSRDDTSTRRSEEASLEETFDAIDDVVMNRQPGEGRDKVKVFGAWLDADVAGRKAGQGNRAAGLIARADRGESLTDQEKAEVFYEEAIHEMKKGKYDTSYALLEKAVSLTGESSRRGGEFKLWAAQALQGVGRNKQAVELLKDMKNHSDLDVRKISDFFEHN